MYLQGLTHQGVKKKVDPDKELEVSKRALYNLSSYVETKKKATKSLLSCSTLPE